MALDKVNGAVNGAIGEPTQVTVGSYREVKSGWAETKRVGRDVLGTVRNEEDPRGADEPDIPDYVM